MAVKYEVSAITGKYTDKEGKEKNRYVKMGVVLETKTGLMLKLEAIPVGFDGWAFLNEPRDQAATGGDRPASRSAPKQESFPDDDIPF
jgi:hypothetical protein